MKAFLAAFAVLAAAAAFGAEPATKGKLAPKPLFRDPIHDGAADPVVVWNRGEGKWFMFYTNRRADVRGEPGVSWVHGTRIGIAESSDAGATWKYRGVAEIGHGKPDYTHWAPDIVDDGKKYHMYLSVVPGIFKDWNAPREIVHLTSENLLSWKFESKLELGSDRVIDATVCRIGEGKWRMWYKDERDQSHIHYADSSDLYHRRHAGVAISDRSSEGPKVFHWKGRFWMIADIWQGLRVASSDDAVQWTIQPEFLLKEPGTAPTDRAKGQHADVYLSGGRAYLLYFTHQGGADADPADPLWQRRTVIQVVELEYKSGRITCDRNQPTYVDLQPPQSDRMPAFHPGARILFQGDSITDGNRGRTADPNHILGHGYQFLIAARFGASLPERRLTFLNRGISGNLVSDLAARRQSDILDLQPDILSILVGVNDADRGVPLDEFEKTYDGLLAGLMAARPGLRLVLCEPFTLPVGKRIGQWEAWSADMKKRQQIVAKLAAKYHAALVRFQKVFDDAVKRAPAEYWIWDGIHPTYAGHQLMADEWERTVQQMWSE